MSLYYSDDPIRDYDRYDAEQEKKLEDFHSVLNVTNTFVMISIMNSMAR